VFWGQHIKGSSALLRLRFQLKVCVKTLCEGAAVNCGRDWHCLCLIPHAAEVKVAELVGYKLQASEADGLFGVATRNVTSPTDAVDDELQAPKEDGAPKGLSHRVDVGGRHRAITWRCVTTQPRKMAHAHSAH
jgi:hypothetical protein